MGPRCNERWVLKEQDNDSLQKSQLKGKTFFLHSMHSITHSLENHVSLSNYSSNYIYFFIFMAFRLPCFFIISITEGLHYLTIYLCTQTITLVVPVSFKSASTRVSYFQHNKVKNKISFKKKIRV